MKIAFILTMPGAASWNGRWSGEGNLYCLIKTFTSMKAKIHAKELLEKGRWSYSWPDGWRVSIEAREVFGNEVKKLKRASQEFCCYDWMVKSILAHNKIRTNNENI